MRLRRRGTLALLPLVAGCLSAVEHRERADRVAASIIEAKQREALGRTEPFSVDRPSETFRRKILLAQGLPHAGPESLGPDALDPVSHWPERGWPYGKGPPEETEAPWDGPEPYPLSFTDALKIGARNSREYQARKEAIFLAALDLDVERGRFRTLFFGTLSGAAEGDSGGGGDGVEGSAAGDATRLFRGGAALAGRIAVDLAKLLTGSRDSALGLFGDASVTIPLLRGAGGHVVTEPLTLAEREVVYAIREFERFKQTFAVDVASGYLEVLRQEDQVANAAENYRSLVVLTRRARALSASGTLPGVQVDQAQQDELRARDSWIAAQQRREAQLDAFKRTLGLPTDARIDLQRSELDALVRRADRFVERMEGEGPGEGFLPADAPVELERSAPGGRRLELAEPVAVRLALENRQDLLVARGRVVDAQRAVAVAADALEAGLTLTARGTAGGRRAVDTATLSDADLDRFLYSAGALLDLPIRRYAERAAYRETFVALERAVRDFQEIEDQVKAEVRRALRDLLEAREGVLIQRRAVRLAESRVESTNLVLQAGRAQIRDVLESQRALLDARNALTAAMIRYRVAELELQRDMGVLAVGADGLYKEFDPDA